MPVRGHHPTLDEVRQFAVARTFFPPSPLRWAIERLGFVQADPIRAPARAQDLTLRHRALGYRAGDLDAQYPGLAIEEDVFINYGFLPRDIHALMHPRTAGARRGRAGNRRARLLLDFVRERGEVHPRDVHARFSHGTVTNYWGGTSNATTHLLDRLHYEGLLRIARRDGGIRIYALAPARKEPAGPAERRARIDALADVIIRKYAPVPAATLPWLLRRLRYAVPQWQGELAGALTRCKRRLAHARVDGVEWYWPAEERLTRHEVPDRVRLVAPFDPLVWDRRRFELLWGWAYRFEAYTPLSKRKLGYYALPLLWRSRIIGWANLALKDGMLQALFGYVQSHPPREPAFKRELEIELEDVRRFLCLTAAARNNIGVRS